MTTTTTTTNFSVQALEPRRLLSASLSSTTTTTDPAATDPGTIVAESWVPYVPDAMRTDVDIVQRDGRAVAVVSVVFPDAGYRVTDWGTPQRDGNRFVVDAKVERWTGPSAQVITRVAHEYPLGALPPGVYIFDFNAWGKSVESETFTVPSDTPPPPPTPEQWIPYTPTEQQTTIDIYQREGRTIARVKIIFPDSGFRVDWGTLTRDGNTFRADAAVDRWTGPALTVMTPMVHEYVLGELPPGAYAFEFSARGTPVERKEFVVPTGPVWEPYQPAAEQTDIEIYQREGRWKARVKLTFNHNGYRVSDWGTLRREGNTFIANAKVERTGGVLPVVTYASHEYDLGELLPGEHAFNFNAWSRLVERKAFVVPTGPTEEWVPYTPTDQQTEIRIVREVGKTTADVKLLFPDNGFRVDWGTLTRDGNRFIADATVDRRNSVFPVATPMSNAYDLGELPAGEYVFEFRARGTLVESKAFHLFEDPSQDWVPYTPTPEQTQIDVTQYQGKHVARVTVVFPDAGYRIDWGTLARDGNTFRADAIVDDYLGPAPDVVTPKRHEYVLGELPTGTYTFEFTARGKPVESVTINVPASNDLVLEGVESNDEFRFFTDATGATILLFWNNDPAMRPGPLPIPRDAHDRFLLNTLGGDDTAVIDLVQHTPLPRNGMVYNGGAGADVLQITNALATDRIEIVGDRVVINGRPITLANVEKVTVDRSTGSELTVGGADVVELEAGQHLESITVKDDAVVRLTGDAQQVSLSTLSVSDGGLLDLRDKTVMLTVPASEADAVMETLHELIAAGRAGNWTGDRGITSSVAAESGNSLYGIGVATVASPLLGSLTTANVQVIAMRYTLKGDLNLDGVVNADDYFRIDQGFLAGANTYAAGDANYDGRVNADDYFAVDQTFLAQRGIPQTTTASSAAVAAPSAARAASTPFSRARVTDDQSVTRRRKAITRVASDVL